MRGGVFWIWFGFIKYLILGIFYRVIYLGVVEGRGFSEIYFFLIRGWEINFLGV